MKQDTAWIKPLRESSRFAGTPFIRNIQSFKAGEAEGRLVVARGWVGGGGGVMARGQEGSLGARGMF